MLARCYRCDATFETDRYGIQNCPSCGSEVYLPDPSAPAPAEEGPPAGGASAQPPGGAPQPGAEPSQPRWGAAPPQGSPPDPRWGAVPPATPPPEARWGFHPPPPPEQSAPFAERERRGFLASFGETWRLAAVEPTRFFTQVRISETRTAVLFGVIAVTAGNLVSLVLGYLTSGPTMGFLAELARRMGGRADTQSLLEMVQGYTAGSFIVQLVLTPVLALAGIYLTAGLFHLLLLVAGGASRGFDATLTVVGYASGVFLIRAVPACGGFIAAIWFMVAAIHGLAAAQRSGTGKAAFAVLSPLLLACAFACLAGTIAGLTGFGTLRGSGGPPSSTGI